MKKNLKEMVCSFIRPFIKLKHFAVVFATLLTFTAFSQNQSINGKVTDAVGEPLVGVNILVKGTTIGTVTDVNGEFTLQAEPSNTLVFRFIGYAEQEIAVGNQTSINVSMSESVSDLEELVVVGYGVKKKSLVTGSISSVDSDDLQNTPVSRADQALQGKTAGVSIVSNSGSPGAATKIRIRGTNSNGNSNPLFIVDGMKVSDINSIDPADIESMEVLKDAASAAIYGTEGGNGVIMITTKKGTKGKQQVSYDFQYGIQSSRSNTELMNASQYEQWMTEAGQGPIEVGNIDTDWLNEIFENAPMQKHHLSFKGGNEKTSYMMSGSFYGQDGIVGGDKANYQRITARANINSQLNKWLNVGTNMSYMNSKQMYIGEDDEYRSVVNNALLMDPLTPVTYSGTPQNVLDLQADGKTILQDEDGNYYGLPAYVAGETTNPVAVLQTYHNTITTDKFLGSAFATITPLKGLSFTSRIGLDLEYRTNHKWTPVYYFSAENNSAQTSIDDNIQRRQHWLWENFGSYNFEVDNHDFTILAGYSAEEYESPDYDLHSAQMVSEGDNFAYHSHTMSRASDEVGGDFSNWTMTSMYSRLSYDYLNKYLLEVSLRRDACSLFPEDKKSAFFKAASLGWLVSEEDFFDIDGIDYFKLRGSWGENGSKSNLAGNEDKMFFLFSGIRYPGSDDVYQSGAEIDKLPNPNLLWERTQQLDVGLDFRFFDSKLSFSADYYNKITNDLIIQGSGPLSVGNEYPSFNGGNVSNTGFDFELGYRNRDSKLKYEINFNLSTLKNEVTSVTTGIAYEGDNLRGYDLTWFEEGYPVWYFKGYKTDGIDAATGEPIVVDTDGIDGITSADQTYIGDPHPDLMYGMNARVEYEGFDFRLFLQGTQGNDVFMGWYRTDRPYTNKPLFMYEERWTSENTNATMPKADNMSDYVYRSDLMVADGSYLRVKQIQLGYTLPTSLVSQIGIDRVRFYASLDDYFTFTKYKGLDPEAGSATDNRQGVDRGIYPIAGKMLFGLTVNF